MPHSHHSHSGQFCKHAKGQLEEVIREAIRQQFRVFGLSEHVPRYRTVDLYPEEADITIDFLARQFEDYVEEAHRLKLKYAPQIALIVGLETDFITDNDLVQLDTLLERHGPRIMYLVGSVHHVNEVPIDGGIELLHKALETTKTKDAHAAREQFLCIYFDAQYRLYQRCHPEIIGHFDLCRLYTPELKFSDYPTAYEKMERNIKYVVEYGALIEINSAAMRKGWATAYPGPDVVEMVLKHGGRFALSDDSHGPAMVGLNYELAATYARSVGINEVWYLEESDTVNIGGRFIRPRRLEGVWWEDEFYGRRDV